LCPPPRTETISPLSGKANSADHVGHSRAANNQRWATIDHRVPDPTRGVVAHVAPFEDLTPQLSPQYRSADI
jgi:hypothetical protein